MKKNTFLFVLLLAINFNYFGQINKNTWMLGGDISFTNEHYNTTNSNKTILTIAPQVGYFFINNFVVGISGRIYKYSKNFTSLSIAPYVRYYFKNIYSQVSFGITNSSFGVNSVPSQTKTYLQGAIGYALFLNDNVALEPSIYYSPSFQDGKHDGSTYGLQIGLQIYLNR